MSRPRRARWPFFALLGLSVVLARPARAGDLDLEDDDDAAPKETPAGAAPASLPIATIKPRSFTLPECLALTDRNHPNLWAARARLASVHARLEEATWIPYWQWSASATVGVIPPLGGTPFYGATSFQFLSPNFQTSLNPFFQFNLRGTVPLYTFGKITAGREAASAFVRVTEWEVEKVRQQTRMDTRRAYYGLMLARDSRYLFREVQAHLDRAVDGIRKKLDKNDQTVDEIDQTRMEIYRDEILARGGDIDRGELMAIAALRFLTGVQTRFDIVDEPLTRPERPVVAVAQYLSAARLFRPEVNMARAGVVARRKDLELQRAKLLPNVGLGLGSSYSVAPSAVQQTAAWIGDPFNRFFYSAALGVEWPLDLMPANARVKGAESLLEEARSLERLALGGIAVEVETAYAAVLEAKNREEAWDRNEKRAKRWMSTVQDGIDLGTKDERWVLEPLRVYINARVEHLRAMMDLRIAMSELARVSGWDAAAPE